MNGDEKGTRSNGWGGNPPACLLRCCDQYLNRSHFHGEAASAIEEAPENRRLYCVHGASLEVLAAIRWGLPEDGGPPHLEAMALHDGALRERERVPLVRSSAQVALRTAQYLALRQGHPGHISADASTLGATDATLGPLGFRWEGSRWVLDATAGRMKAALLLRKLRRKGVLPK